MTDLEPVLVQSGSVVLVKRKIKIRMLPILLKSWKCLHISIHVYLVTKGHTSVDLGVDLPPSTNEMTRLRNVTHV